MTRSLLAVTRSVFAMTVSVFAIIANAHAQQPTEERIKAVANSAKWQSVLQYRASFPLGLTKKSIVDDPSYFLAPDGAENPEAELRENIKQLFDSGEINDEHPRCRFTGRYLLLEELLPELKDSRGLTNCKRYSEWLQGLSPHSYTLIYPANFLNNPASMFGHTFLRADTAEQNESTRMLAYAVSYGAGTNESNGMAFALNGVFGGYHGAYTISPYYKLIKKYSDREYRDIWEYTLSFDEKESEALTALVWEHNSTYSDYYFLDDNCSFQLLFLFDYLRPEFKLVEEFPFWAIPSDTVKAITQHDELVTKTIYRPSAATILRHQVAQASPGVVQAANQISSGLVSGERVLPTGVEPEIAAAALELAGSLLTYRTMRERDSEKREVLAKRAHQVLLARSAYPSGSSFTKVATPRIRPDQGHSTIRAQLGVGYEADRIYSEHSLRLAYHDMLDPQGGYVPGASISIFSLDFRYYEEQGLELERFMPVAIESLTSRDPFIKPISWSFEVGAERKHSDSEDGIIATVLRGGPGVSYNITSASQMWLLSQFGIEYSGAYDPGNWAFGSGIRSGAYLDVSEELRVLLEGKVMRFAFEQAYTSLGARVALSQRITKNSAAVFEVGRSAEFGRYENNISATLRLYF